MRYTSNKKPSRRYGMVFLAFLVGVALLLTGCGGGSSKPVSGDASSKPAEKYPTKPITLIVPHAVGGSVDLDTRVLTPYLEKQLGTSIIVQNIEEAGGRKAREQVFKANPDGYTLMCLLTPSTQMGEVMYAPQYTSTKYTYLANVFGKNYKAIAVPKDSPINTFNDLVKASQIKPIVVGGGGGKGSSSDLQSILLSNKAGLKHIYVPLNGTGDILNGLLGKNIEAAFNDLAGLYTNRDKIKILAIQAPQRDPRLPDIPTLDELGYKGLEMPWMIGYVAPPGLPKNIQDILVKAFQDAVNVPEFKQWSDKSGNLTEFLGPEDFLKVSEDNLKQVKSVENLIKESK